MAPWIWPKLACLWALVTACSCLLAWMLRRNLSPPAWYFCVTSAQNLMMWWAVYHAHYWRVYYSLFVGFQFLGHLLVLVAALTYTFDIGKRLKSIPDSFPLMATCVVVTLVATNVAVACWRDGKVSQEQVLWVEHAAQMGVCGLLWLVCLMGKMSGVVRVPQYRGFLFGALGLYSFGMLAAALRVYVPMQREMGWAVDMTAQLGACLWWLRSYRRSTCNALPL